ncbi:hypoxanthine phosphoribosyltransferase [Vallitalea sp. AN17-2]|uniref:Hypoxanthine phosphoribosyltransferase n=2 Tax=Vallitalea maricola TaxID=3074433 RepID=A0ACB5UI18_9FIRM|nr:hypoxanthine phosphoribosyltransferase [Vallitalea sp. AN17-2]
MHNIQTLISAEELNARIAELGKQISEDYQGKEVNLICVLKGGVMFMVDLSKQIQDIPVTMDFMAVSSYGNEVSSSGVVKIVKDLDESIEGKEVIIVEDIIDSGRTLSYLVSILKDRKPNSIKICTLLDKPDRRVVEDVQVDYTGFSIPDKFVLGYGLDYMQRYRNLPFIGTMDS